MVQSRQITLQSIQQNRGRGAFLVPYGFDYQTLPPVSIEHCAGSPCLRLATWWSAWSFLFRVHSHPLYRHRDNNHNNVTVTG
ncbi:hypothetical protein, partial [Ferrovum sp.]|uniref:hypothetical protein n=1 Tax=Ferrovum sp. TaxID=2609467 RepID=UPI0026096BDC